MNLPRFHICTWLYHAIYLKTRCIYLQAKCCLCMNDHIQTYGENFKQHNVILILPRPCISNFTLDCTYFIICQSIFNPSRTLTKGLYMCSIPTIRLGFMFTACENAMKWTWLISHGHVLR